MGEIVEVQHQPDELQPAVVAPILDAIYIERQAQVAKWGHQRHPSGTGSPSLAKLAEYHTGETERAAKDGSLTWRHILLEEVYEALAEEGGEPLVDELVQVAAVCAAWIEDLARTEKEQEDADAAERQADDPHDEDIPRHG